ncbi:hypothetical protein CR152_01155 [Massilia violaceinigra]|uniref:Secretion system X translation initiation factor n=1 Tax=Massilia violaceinigra TaxID=2045208 RepID=A0A2D2DE55_9BURK|nr:hypothetical protein [Massilia violaceinigra]ATQ73267.1 hypothetical protein CR152_01155 [Massilia violaceinigra]
MKKMTMAVALGATLLACYFAPDDDTDMIPPAQARSIAPAPAVVVQAPPVEAEAEAPLLEIRPRTQDEELGNAFARQSWQAQVADAAPVKPADSAVTKPVQASASGNAGGAPELPIRLLGRFLDDGRQAYFLQVEERNVVAYVGDKIDESYTFDSAGDDTLTFTYLPLRKKQTLAVGEMN